MDLKSVSLVLICFLLCGCPKKPIQQIIPTLPLSSVESNPGEVVYIYDTGGIVSSTKDLKVKIGDVSTDVLAIDPSGIIAFSIPNIVQGQYQISLIGDNDTIAKSFIAVKAHQSILVVCSMTNIGNITVLKSMSYQGEYNIGFNNTVPQVSFDLVDSNNMVIYSAGIPDPLANGIEVFNSPDSIIRVIPEQNTFAIKIPAITQAAFLSFYSSPANVNLAADEDRKTRKKLSTIKLSSLKK